MTIYDLTHPLTDGMMVYPGDPAVTIQEGLVHEQDYCHVDRLHLNSHTGTHIDAPFHFLAGGKTITDYDVGRFVLPGIAVDLTHKADGQAITPDDLDSVEIQAGSAIVFVTGWYRYFGTERYLHHPYLSKETADYLVGRGVSIVAVDFLNVDRTLEEAWDAHPALLGNDILIVENLNQTLALTCGKPYLFSFLPLKVTGSDGSPIRAVAIEL